MAKIIKYNKRKGFALWQLLVVWVLAMAVIFAPIVWVVVHFISKYW